MKKLIYEVSKYISKLILELCFAMKKRISLLAAYTTTVPSFLCSSALQISFATRCHYGICLVNCTVILHGGMGHSIVSSVQLCQIQCLFFL